MKKIRITQVQTKDKLHYMQQKGQVWSLLPNITSYWWDEWAYCQGSSGSLLVVAGTGGERYSARD